MNDKPDQNGGELRLLGRISDVVKRMPNGWLFTPWFCKLSECVIGNAWPETMQPSFVETPKFWVKLELAPSSRSTFGLPCCEMFSMWSSSTRASVPLNDQGVSNAARKSNGAGRVAASWDQSGVLIGLRVNTVVGVDE